MILTASHHNFVHAVEDELQSGERQSKTSVERLGKTFDITDKNLIKELTELAIVRQGRAVALADTQSVKERFDSIVSLYNRQANLSHRTSQSVLRQQYSTPAPIAFLMGIYCGVNKPGRYLEPSAGNGLLTIAGRPENFLVNEIDSVRLRHLKSQDFAEVISKDATYPLSIEKFDAVLSNPPFGRLQDTVTVNGYHFNDLDHLMIVTALDHMKDSGRAALIIGGHTTWDELGRPTAGKNRTLLNYLYHFYSVDEVIALDGHALYSRQGTSFDIRLILISGRKAQPAGFAPLKTGRDVIIKSFEELFQRVSEYFKPSLKNSMQLKLKLKSQALKLGLTSKSLAGLDMPYLPASNICNTLQVDTPDSMGYEIHQALHRLKMAVGSVEGYVQQKLGYKTHEDLCAALSAEQSDAVALAIYNIEERSQSLIVGDQTGIGKGRIAAAMIRYGCLQGLSPIFITEKPNLFSDLYRDLKAIGSETLKPYIVNARESKTHIKDEDGVAIYQALPAHEQQAIIASGALPKEFDFVVLTYTQISGAKISKSGQLLSKSPKGNWLESIAAGNIIVMDEAHNASGDSNTGKTLQDIVSKTKGVTFLSATFAKRPDNMPIYAMKTAMSEANMSRQSLIDGIEKGGVALQEVLSAQLVQHGQMIRRERSFEGIEVNYITLDEKADEHKAISDNVTQIVRDIIAFQKNFIDRQVKALDKLAAKSSSGGQIENRKGASQAGVDNTPYFSKVFQVVNQMLFSIKAEAVADRALIRLSEGMKPVIAFSNTMGSFIESLVDEDESGPEGKTINADFATVLQRGLDGVLRYTERNAMGESVYKSFDVSELEPPAQAEYHRIATQISAISSGISISPIDLIKQKLTAAGYRVAEVTGRKLEVQLQQPQESPSQTLAAPPFIGVVKTRKRENTNDAFRKFQNNQVDVLLINQSGSTGASAHAIATKLVSADQVRQRVMILLQAELDINTEVQKRGRVNRTGQLYKPIYDYMFSAIPAEKRLMMMLQKKLKSLDANTTSNQKQSQAVLSVDDFLNKIGDRVAVGYLRDNPAINTMLDDPLGLSGAESSEGSDTENAAHRVSGRVAVLPTNEQEKFYSEILKLYTQEVEYLKQTGAYDLEVDSLDLKATTVEKSIRIVGKGGQSAFGDNTYLEKCEVNILRKPYTTAELDNIYVQVLAGQTPEQMQEDLINRFASHSKSILERTLNLIETDFSGQVAAIKQERKYALLGSDSGREQYLQEREQQLATLLQAALQRETTKLTSKSETIEQFFKFFRVGRKLSYPLDFDNTSGAKSMAICLGIKVDLDSDKPFLPSAMRLQLAIASPKKRIDIPLSKAKDVRAIMGASTFSDTGAEWSVVKQQWQALVQSQLSNDRGFAYIVTGNLLQSYGHDLFSKGRLISYSTSDGKTLKGRLMPEAWEPGEEAENNFVKVPIGKALKVIAGLSEGKSISTENQVTFIRSSEGDFKMLLPAARSIGGDIYLDENLNALMESGRFDKVSNYMSAVFKNENLPDVVELLQTHHNDSVQLSLSQLSLIETSIQADKIVEELPHVTQPAANEKILVARPEVQPTNPLISTEAVKLRLALKAKALNIKLKLAA